MGCVCAIEDYRNSNHQKTAEIVSIPVQHLKADGTIDKRYGEKPERRNNDDIVISKKMKCLYDTDEIMAVYNVFAKKVEEAPTRKKELAAKRNLCMFVTAINIGLRGGDLCSLKWHHIFNSDWELMDRPEFKPEKQNHGNVSKRVELTWSHDFEVCIMDYLDYKNKYDKKQELGDYIFSSQKGNHIGSKEWYKIVEETRKEAGITQKIGTHGLRKTMVHSYISMADDRYDAKLDMQEALNHSDIRVTERYACTDDDKIQRGKQKMACIYG